MHIVGERLESSSADRRRKAIRRRDVAAVLIERVALVGAFGCGLFRMLQIPAFINDDIFPAVLFEVLIEPIGVGFELIFSDGEAVGVPAHGRSGSEQRSFCLSVQEQRSAEKDEREKRYAFHESP